MKTPTIIRLLCTLLALCLLGGSFAACSKDSEVPDGYQYATCKGEYFLLFIPTQWTVNTESGVSGGHYSPAEGTAVSMTEVPFDKPSEDGTPDTTATVVTGCPSSSASRFATKRSPVALVQPFFWSSKK